MREAMRTRRVRFPAPLKPGQDTGPLLVRDEEGRPRLQEGIAGSTPAERLEMPYPAAPPGKLTLKRWTRRWPPERSRAGHLADLALSGSPALAALLPFLMLAAPGHAVRAGLAAGAACLFIAAGFARIRLRRAESLRIHARFWDRLIAAPPAGDSEDASEQATRLHRALRGALHFSAGKREAAAQAAALLLLAILAAVFHGPALLLALPPAALLAFLAEAWRGVLARRLAQARQETARLERRLAQAMPSLRQLGLAGKLMAALEQGQRACAKACARLNVVKAVAQDAPFWLAAACLTLCLAVGLPLEAILLLAPATHTAALFGRTAAGLLRAQHDAGAAAVLASPEDAPEIACGGMAEIRLEGIGLRHEGAQTPLLEEVCLTLRRGEAVALTGPSGSGKSTLIEILLGLRTPQQGVLLIDGERLPWTALAAYRARVAGVFQDMPPGVSTIRTTIGPDIAGIGEEDILAAAADAGLAQAIAALPMGLETLVLEGGFPQSFIDQLLIAQALAQRPALLVLDETFSGLDAATAAHIIAAARRRGMALLFATHRADLAALADRRVRLGGFLERNPRIAG